MEIVFVDDQDDIREVITMILEDSLEAKIVDFPDTKSALSYIENNKEKVSLIISDLHLEEGTGLNLYEQIKELEIPFFLMTGEDPKKLAEQVSASFSGTDKNKIIAKPIDEETLISSINSVLQVA